MAKKVEYKIVGPFCYTGSKAEAIRAFQVEMNELGREGWILPIEQMVLRPYTAGTWRLTTDRGATEFVARKRG